jgi:hypothetical protein
VELTTLNRQQIQQLIEGPQGPAVSLYMPTHRTGRETRQDPIRLKNLLKQADSQLETLGYGPSIRHDVLAAAESLPDDVAADFWRNGNDGLALLLSREGAKCFKLPMEVPEVAVASDQFILTPLLRYLQGDGHFFVLAVSQNDVRLMAGDKHDLHEIDLESLPSDLVDALNIDEYQSSLQFHSHTPGVTTNGDAIFHGHGGGEGEDRKKEILQFFHRIDAPLTKFLENERAPLVFAGVDYLFPIFQQACSYRNLVSEPVTGNPEGQSSDQLHDPAWKLVEPLFSKQLSERLEQYAVAASRDLGSDDLDEIATAARQAQVATLLVAESAHAGRTAQQSNEQVTQIAAICTDVLRGGGEVYVCDDPQMPNDATLAAIYRYQT